MKILILSDKYPPEDKGGAGRVALNLAKGFEARGHQVFVITTTQNKENSVLDPDFKQGVDGVYSVYVPAYHARWMGYLSLYNPWAVRQVKKIVKQIKPDLVHAHNLHNFLSYHCLKIAKKAAQAVFLSAHDVMLVHYGKWIELIGQGNKAALFKKLNYKIVTWQQIKRFKKRFNPLKKPAVKYYLKYVDKIFAISHELKKFLAANGIINTCTVHNGININQWRVEQSDIDTFKHEYNLLNKKVVLFVGRLNGLKGEQQLIEAMRLVSQKISSSALLIVGTQEKYDLDHPNAHVVSGYIGKIFNLAKKYNIKLVSTGFIHPDKIKTAFHSADAVVTPSIYFDPFNLINIEAMACQKPVVGTCFGGTPEIVQDGQTGFIVNPFNTHKMAEKIIYLLEHPDQAKKMGQAGFERVKQEFSLDKQVEETLKVYQEYL